MGRPCACHSLTLPPQSHAHPSPAGLTAVPDDASNLEPCQSLAPVHHHIKIVIIVIIIIIIVTIIIIITIIFNIF